RAGPVARGAEPFQLLDNDVAVLFLPFPGLLEEFFAADVVAVFDESLFFERALDDGLGGDAGVVGAGEPEDFATEHARAAGEDVLDGVVEDVAKGEDTGDVGWGDDDGISRALSRNARRVGDETFPVKPELIPFRLDRLWIVGFGDFRHILNHEWTRMNTNQAS